MSMQRTLATRFLKFYNNLRVAFNLPAMSLSALNFFAKYNTFFLLQDNIPIDYTLEISNHQLRGLLEITNNNGDQQRRAKKSLSPKKKPPPPRRRNPPPRKRSPQPPKAPTRPPPQSPLPSPSTIPSPSPFPSPSPTPTPTSACSITIDSATQNFRLAIEMKDRNNRPTVTACFSLSDSQNELLIGFKAASTTPGWLALGYNPNNNGGMLGTSAVFAQSCGSSCVQGYSKTMNAFVFQQFSPSKVDFSEIKAGKDENGLLVGTAKMPLNTGSIVLMMAAGPVGNGNVPQIHYGVPRAVALRKSDLI
jgi:hypothetical protein